jgi:hypothetical protein
MGSIFASALLIYSGVANAKVLTCKSEKLKICSSNNCEDKKAITTIILDTDNKSYQRCDSSCDKYPANIDISGAFITASPNLGTFIKVNQLDRTFVDIATMSSTILMNFGVCK